MVLMSGVTFFLFLFFSWNRIEHKNKMISHFQNNAVYPLTSYRRITTNIGDVHKIYWCFFPILFFLWFALLDLHICYANLQWGCGKRLIFSYHIDSSMGMVSITNISVNKIKKQNRSESKNKLKELIARLWRLEKC